MSVLVKGMEMPKSCKDCPCHKFAYDNWDRPYNYCGVTGGVTLVNCPLVEVPTPHGRLIDADEVKRKMLKFGFRAPDMTKTELLEDEITTIIESEVPDNA